MQIKKFEAPTIQEALDTIKRELGPEAIILQTKTNKSAFGLLSRDSVEVTAAVSERSLQKKRYVESKLPDNTKDAVKKMPAQRQAEFYNKYSDKQVGAPAQSRVHSRVQAASARMRQAASLPEARATEGVPARGRAAPPRGSPIGSMDEHLDGAVRAAQDRVEIGGRRSGSSAPAGGAGLQASQAGSAQPAKNVTPTRYIDIDEHETLAGSTGGAASPRSGSGSPFHSVEEEVRHLKRMIEELKSGQDKGGLSGSGAQALMSPVAGASQGALSTPALQDAFEQLVVNGVDKRYALQLLKQVAFELGTGRCESPDDVLDQLAAELMRTTEFHSPLSSIRRQSEMTDASEPEISGQRKSRPAVIALVGPTGVGKTTTVAKMASEALLKRGLRVGLINLDSYKVAAFDQLGTYAKILNVPFRSVTSSEELVAAIQDFQSLDLVLIDTTGRSQRDPSSLKDLHGMLKTVPDLRSQLVLSVTTRDNELYDMANRFAIFRPEGISISKLDEATIYGSLYNVHQKVKLPLLYFTTGQRVPEDIEEATPERVAALILDL